MRRTLWELRRSRSRRSLNALLRAMRWSTPGRAEQRATVSLGRLVEEALDSASALLSGHRATLDRLAERLSEHETVNGSEVTAMLASANMTDASNVAPDGSLTPDGDPWQDASLWYQKTRAAQDAGLTDSATVGKTASDNGHEAMKTSPMK